MHGKYGDREAAAQAVALVEDIGCRRRRREAGAERKRRDSHRPAPPAGHATRQHYDTALLRFERGNTAGPGGVVVPMPAPPLTAEGLRAEDMNADGTPKPHVFEPTKAEIVEAAAARLASTESAASGAALIGAMNGPGDALIGFKQDALLQLARQIDAEIVSICGIPVRLIEADTPAPAAQGMKPERMRDRWVIPVGDQSVVVFPCDAGGWINHTPTADAVCPVPDGIKFEARWANDVSGLGNDLLRRSKTAWTVNGGTGGGLRAWRPVTQA